MGKLKKQIKEKQAEAAALEKKIRARLGKSPKYKIPKEATLLLQQLNEAAGKVTDYAQYAKKGYEDYLETSEQRAYGDMPGYDKYRQESQERGRKYIDAAARSGALTPNVLAGVRSVEDQALQDLALSNANFRDMALRELGQAQATSGVGTTNALTGAEVTGANLRSSGLLNMQEQREKQFQLNKLDPYYNKLNFDITMLGNVKAEELAARNRKAQVQAGVLSAAGSVIGSVFGGAKDAVTSMASGGAVPGAGGSGNNAVQMPTFNYNLGDTSPPSGFGYVQPGGSNTGWKFDPFTGQPINQ